MSDSLQRFSFGKNWLCFLESLNESRTQEAIVSLQQKLNCKDLKEKVFLDIGSGSGLFSLAANRLGAKVFSFDYDQDSVKCTQFLKDNYGDNAYEWLVEQGSVLDQEYMKKFGQVDIVYSWGVLHHTGSMYQAFENIADLVKEQGQLFISIYNDQGRRSKLWRLIKKTYVSVPFLRIPLCILCGLWLWKVRIMVGLLHHGNPFKYIIEYGKNNRGMSAWHNLKDWVGGYPFEVAKPEQIFDYFFDKNFQLNKMKTCAGGLGCNEFVFVKTKGSTNPNKVA